MPQMKEGFVSKKRISLAYLMSLAFFVGVQVHADQETMYKILFAVNSRSEKVAINLLANESDSAEKDRYFEAILQTSIPENIAHFAREAAKNDVIFLSEFGLNLLARLAERERVIPEVWLYLAEYLLRIQEDDEMRLMGYLAAQRWYFGKDRDQHVRLSNGELSAVEVAVNMREALRAAGVSDGHVSSIAAERFIVETNPWVKERRQQAQEARLEGQPAPSRSRFSYGEDVRFPSLRIERVNGAGGPAVDGSLGAIHVRVFSENEELPSDEDLRRLSIH